MSIVNKTQSDATAKAVKNTEQKQTGPDSSGIREYVDQYSKGIASVKDIFEDEGSGKYIVKVSIMQGDVKNMDFIFHRLTVSSEIALGILLEHRDAIINNDIKVVAHINVTNPRPFAFINKQGDNAGKASAIMVGYLSRIRRLLIDGELVYKDERYGKSDENEANAA